ncbi:uracil-DNA glycosylase [Spirochaetia bacterium]|nr:uracil-DNA glycosylase [Spirochaetia bacterium]
MTAEQKTDLARLLDTTGDYLRDGYARDRDYAFTTDTALSPAVMPLSVPNASAPIPGRTAPVPQYGERAPDAVLGVPAAIPSGDSLEAIAAEVRACAVCPLAAGRKQAVPGEGAARPLVLVVGEGPGADEDASGRPFVGKAGQLLDRMLASIGLSRETNCFIANVVKCRPPNNRDPEPGESSACAPFLARQITLLAPRIILTLGRIATHNLLNTTEPIGRLRGRFTEYSAAGIPLLPTYHPSALLRDESLKRPAWEDLKTLRAHLAELDSDYAAMMEGQA